MKWVFWIFMALYVVSVLLLVVGAAGMFGAEEDPLSAVFLLPLGLPWNVLADRLGLAGVASLLMAPLINGAIFYWFWKR